MGMRRCASLPVGPVAMTSSKPVCDNPFFCILPWIHLHVTPASEVFPCCHGGMEQPVGNLLESDFRDLANAEGMKAMRRRMRSLRGDD